MVVFLLGVLGDLGERIQDGRSQSGPTSATIRGCLSLVTPCPAVVVHIDTDSDTDTDPDSKEKAET